MSLTRVFLLIVTTLLIGNALTARRATATSYVPHTVIEEEQTDKRSTGIVCLFHGTDLDVIRHLIGQNFSAFREPVVDTSPVGKVRLTEAIGAHHLEAMTIEGELKEGDVVQLRENYALVILINGRCESLPQRDQKAGK